VPPAWISTAYVTALCSALAATTAAANSAVTPTATDTDAAATSRNSNSSEITEAVVVPWRSLVHNLLCGSLPRVPTLQELIRMRLSFEAAVATAAEATVEQVPTVTESDAPAQELQPVEEAAASTTTAAVATANAAAASADAAAVTNEADSASSEIVSAEGEEQPATTTSGVGLVNNYEAAVEAAPAQHPLYNVPLWFELLEGGIYHLQFSATH
jgi:hypothetical protein